MCGIFGLVISTKESVSDDFILRVIRELFIQSESRGKEASGIAVSAGPTTHVLKMPARGSRLIRSQEFRDLSDVILRLRRENYPVFVIGHSRLATNGGYAANANNQPVVRNGSVIVHNGIIVNADMLWKKHPMLRKHADVDTEILIALYEYYKNKEVPGKALKHAYRSIMGEASIALFDASHSLLFLATNTGSIYVSGSDRICMFSSEKYISEQVIKSVFPTNTQAAHIIRLPAGTGLCVSVSRGKIIRTDTNTYSLMGISPATGKTNRIIEHKIPKNYFPAADMFRNSVSKLQKHAPDVDAILKIRRCTRCIMPSTMPLIVFDENGVCNFCRTYMKTRPLGQSALEQLIAPLRSPRGVPDCIVALSGGRDSSYGLHFAKKVLKLNPVAYTYDWGMVTDIARRNQSRMCAALGVEHIVVSADINRKLDNIRKNIEAWLAKPDLGMVTLLMAGDKQAEYYAEDVKRKTGIRLIMYCRGNTLEDERFKFGYYGIFDGTPGGVIHNLPLPGKLKMLGYYARRFLTNPKYINSSVYDTAWAFASAYLMTHNFMYLWQYIPWDEQHIVSTLKKQYAWETPSDTVATWRIDDGTPPFYNYIYYRLQGFTEHDGLRSNQIREGVITRSEALRLVIKENRPRYEALKWYFDRVGIDGDKALSTIDSLPIPY
jgi:glutamine---fructose-6-phosphate transaminase (isomerizing)